jgi:hypothetical protein
MKFFREAMLQVRIRNDNFDGYIATILIKGLRVSFSILKSTSSTTNSAVIRIWNLSQDNRNLIKDYGDEVTLYAGYREDGGPQVLFVGDTTTVSHIYELPEIVTVLECGDGEKYVNQLRVSLSYAANVQARTIISGIAAQMGLQFVEFASSNNLVYRQGYKFIGLGKDALDIVCAKLGLQWSIQNNQLQVIPINGTISEPIIQVNEGNGMQGIPQRYTYRSLDLYRSIDQRNTGYKVNVALNPFILPGSKIDLASAHLNFRGPYRVETIRHEGDTFGFLWSSQIECTELLQGATIGVN